MWKLVFINIDKDKNRKLLSKGIQNTEEVHFLFFNRLKDTVHKMLPLHCVYFYTTHTQSRVMKLMYFTRIKSILLQSNCFK